jgi:hypothetical protein
MEKKRKKYLCIPNPGQGIVSLFWVILASIFHHIKSRTFRALEDKQAQDEGRYHWRSEDQANLCFRIPKGIETEINQERGGYPERNPQLPGQD